MKSYKKYYEYRICLAVASGNEMEQFLYDPRLCPVCVSKDHYVAQMRFLKNLHRPNRLRNAKYTLGCWERHLAKKKKRG